MFFPTNHKADKKVVHELFLEIICCRIVFQFSKEWGSIIYFKTVTEILSQRFNGLHSFLKKVPADAISKTCFNGCNEPLYGLTKEEGIQTVCRAHETVYVNKPLISKPLLEQSLRLLVPGRLKKIFPNTSLNHGHKDGSSIANIFTSKAEIEILIQSAFQLLVWKRYIGVTINFYSRL